MSIKFTLVTLITGLSFFANAQRAVCPPDTILYVYEKATELDTLTFDPFFTSAAYQYFECPQQISVNGVRFYAWKTDTTDGNSMQITVELRKATSDSIPGTTLLASSAHTLLIPDSLDGPLSQYAVSLTWTPTSVSGPYIIVIKTDPTSPPFTMLHSHLNGANSDGNEEWLSGVRQGFSWIKSYDYIVNSEPFDADFLIEPFVSYNINASFINDPECLFDELGETVSFFNDGAPIVDSRMYNRYAFHYSPNRQAWNYGDGVTQNAANPIHFYPTNGPYVATMTAKILSWTSSLCQSSVTQIIKEKPAQDFTHKTNNLEVNFTNETFGLFSSIHYDFGDGNTSVNEDPKHKYFQPGTYWVCQTMMTSCGEIKQCKNVAVATNTALNCGKDSVRYTAARGTDTKIRKLRPTNPGRLFGIGQRFDATQPMIVHGFSFYANHEGLFKDSYPVTCRIWDKGGNNLPDGPPLGESVVHINKIEVDTLYNDSTRYTAIFDRPVQILDDYILTIEYDGTIPVHIGVSDWLEHDGDGDLLAIGKINDTTWVTAASVAVFNCEGAACDMDVIIEPLIEFNLDANFGYDFDCMDLDVQPVELYDLSSSILRSKVYNTIAFNTSFVQAFDWDFGDATAVVNLVNPSHNFQGNGPFDVTLTVFMDGWTNDCVSTQVHNVPVPPTGGFSYEQVTSQVNFIDSSFNAEEYLWTFSDLTVSTLANPVHYFTEIGKFEVCQYVSNVCGSDTICDSITVNVVGIPEAITENLHIYPNPAKDYITVDVDFSKLDGIEMEVLDLQGRIVKALTLAASGSNNQIYVGDLARGSYLLRLKADQFEGTKMLILTDH